MTADIPDGYTATLGTPSGDAEAVEVPGWWMKPDGSKPHRWSEKSCPKVGCVPTVEPANREMVSEACEVAPCGDDSPSVDPTATVVITSRIGTVKLVRGVEGWEFA